LVFIIFLISALVLEGILRRDEAATKTSKQTQTPPAPFMELPASDTSSVLILAKAIEQHSQKAPQPIATRVSKPEADIAIGVHHHH
jgi:hypothetical protein